ncbi:uncharacterized protein LOC142571665 [Dermacentor variabilis]|uniref:uncharacterized protein LOC142571665 n=1 Tax=Dermacentor variabilis TaxID=34621 RepID=UPI003F5B8D1F
MGGGRGGVQCFIYNDDKLCNAALVTILGMKLNYTLQDSPQDSSDISEKLVMIIGSNVTLLTTIDRLTSFACGRSCREWRPESFNMHTCFQVKKEELEVHVGIIDHSKR